MRIRTIGLLALIAGGITGGLRAQTTVNPDISIIPRFRVDASNRNGTWSRPDYTFEELEMVATAYLNPFARGTVVLTLPGPDIELGKLGIEEVYASILRGLPLDLNLQFGKYRTAFGKLNQMHPHQWPFLTQPLEQERFLGENGLNDLAVTASLLLPTGDIATTLSVDLLRGTAIGGGAGIRDTTGAAPFYANSARLSGFFPLGDESDLEVGLSGCTGIHDPYHRQRFYYANLDFKYKWRPSSYTSLTVQGEYLRNFRKAFEDAQLHPFLDAAGNPASRSISSGGAYLYGDLQFLKIFSAGARLDWSESPYSAADRARAVAIFLGYYPVEETIGLRFQYQRTAYSNTDLPARSVDAVALQMMFSLGPHKAHPF